MPGAPQESGSRMHIFGDTLGSTIVVRGALHIITTIIIITIISMAVVKPSQAGMSTHPTLCGWYCTVLYCTVLYCTVLYCTIL